MEYLSKVMGFIIDALNDESAGGFFFHATDDLPEVRKVFFEFLDKMSCSFEAYVGRKIPALYENKHNGKEAEFYADLLSPNKEWQ